MAITEAQQLAVLADVCDAADPDIPDEQRLAAVRHAVGIDAEYAVAMSAELLRAFIESVRQVFGHDVAAGTMAEVRARAATYAKETP